MRKGDVQTAAVPDTGRLNLPEQDAALFREMLDGWISRRLGAQRHKPTSVNRDLAVVMDMARFANAAPWYWTEELFERWCYEIGVTRSLAVSSQRHYQGAVRAFLAYLTDNIRFRNEVRRLYGTNLVQICHAENCIPHVIDRELATERRALTHEEIDRFFNRLSEAIARAGKFASKDFRPLQRDKALFFLMYAAGLRISEARGLNIGSFQPNPQIPGFERHGFISVWGKGSRGSGPRHRLVPITHADLPPLLAWYESRVRPHFMANADPNEEALFLSERGRRMALSTMESRFQHALEIAGLDGEGLVPHCLRHSSVTHEGLRMSLEANRIKHGHTYAATTQTYTHLGDEFVREEVEKAVSSQLDAALKEKDDERK